MSQTVIKQQLFDLLQRCTVRLSTKQEDGTGFFVAPGLILTCAHVIEGARNDFITVNWQNQIYTSIVESLPEDTEKFDLALLRLEHLIPNHPCVYLEQSIEVGDILYSYGYTDQYPNGDPATFESEGSTGDKPPLLKFKSGQVRPGLSGSPLLNQRTGMVCGIVIMTRDRSTDLGGRGIPTDVIFSQWSALVGQQREFHQQNTSWKNLLSGFLSQDIPENIPDSGVVKFVGRQQALSDLHQILQQNHQVAIKAAITGMGGIGKTELAIQYALHHKHTYPGGICWLQARTKNVGIQIVDYAKSLLNLNPKEDVDLLNQVRFCWQQWRDGDVLIVLDDAIDYRQIQPYLPSAERFKVLITTRQQLQLPIIVLTLDVLSEQASIELLSSLVGSARIQQQLEDAKKLCSWLGYLPLGLELVGRFLLQEPDLSLAKMLSRLDKKRLNHKALDEEEITAQMTAKLGVAAAFDLSWERLDKQAKQLGCLLSFFALTPISWSLVEEVVKAYDWEIESDDLKEEVRETLVRWHLLQYKGDETFQLHELIREFFQAKLTEITQANRMEHAFATAIATVATQLPDTPTRQGLHSVTINIPHIEKVAKVKSQVLSDDVLQWLFVGLARFYNGQGLYSQVETWCELGLSALETRFGEIELSDTKAAVAALWVFQGKALRIKGQYELALEKYQKSIEILYHNEHSQDKQILVRAFRGQGHVYRLLGDHDKSIHSYEESRRLAKAIKFDKGEARAAYGVARIYRLKGELETAALRYEQAKIVFDQLELPIEEAWAFFGLAEVQRMSWKLEQSKQMYSAALEQFKELGHKEGEAYAVWGTGDTSRLLGGFEAENENFNPAKKYFDDAKRDYECSLEICQQIGDRRSAAWALLGLAEVSRMEGKYQTTSPEEAIAKYQDALFKYQQAYSLCSGQECVEEAHTFLGIAATKRLLKSQGITDNTDIGKLYADAIEIYQAQNRNMNYCIVDVLIDRALYYFSQGTLEQAQSELSQAETICIDNDYAGEKKLIEKIRSQQDSSELHTLNFP